MEKSYWKLNNTQWLFIKYSKGLFSPAYFQFSSVQFNSVQFSSIQFSSDQISSVQFNSVQFNSDQFSSDQFSSALDNTFTLTYHYSFQFSSIQFSSVQFSSIKFSSDQFSSVQFSSAVLCRREHALNSLEVYGVFRFYKDLNPFQTTISLKSPMDPKFWNQATQTMKRTVELLFGAIQTIPWNNSTHNSY